MTTTRKTALREISARRGSDVEEEGGGKRVEQMLQNVMQMLTPLSPLVEQMKQLTDKVAELTDRLDKQSTKMDKQSEQMTEMSKQMEDMRKQMQTQIQEMKTEMAKQNRELKDLKAEMETNQRVERGLHEVQRQQDRAMTDLKMRESWLRFRGIPEDQELDEGLWRRLLAEELAKILEWNPDQMDAEIDVLYRVQSYVARTKGLPRDVIIQFTRKVTKEKILQHYYNNGLTIRGKKITVLQEIPAWILQRRRDFEFLTRILRQQNIRFRWNFPSGLVVFLQNKRFTVETPQEAENFIAQVLKPHETFQERPDNGQLKKKAIETATQSILQIMDKSEEQRQQQEQECLLRQEAEEAHQMAIASGSMGLVVRPKTQRPKQQRQRSPRGSPPPKNGTSSMTTQQIQEPILQVQLVDTEPVQHYTFTMEELNEYIRNVNKNK